MKIQRTFTTLFLAMTLVLSNVVTVFAAPARVPPLPSNSYGTVKVDGANVPVGTNVQALIGGQVFAQKTTTMYLGDSVYSLKVVGDDPDTPTKDGGVEGDTIQFKIGDLFAAETGIWHSGSNVSLNLTATSANELIVSSSGTGSGTVLSDPIGIDCGPDCSETYAYNTPVTLTATAAPGSTFAGWSGEGCAGTGTCAVVMDADKSITAEFTQDQYTLTITSDHGTVTKDPDDPTYTYGQEVDLTAIPAVGWSFASWSGDVNSTDNPVTITMDGNKDVTASYTENIIPVTVTVDSGQSKVFGDTDPVFTYTSSESGATFTGALSRTPGEEVGTYAITQGTLAAVGNYVITFVPADFSITPKPITVTADTKSKVFGEVDPELTYTSSENGVAFTGALSREPGEDVGVYAIIQGTLSAGDNYTITFVSADLTIATMGVTVTADSDQSKVFGDADPVFTYTSSENGITFTGSLSREPGEDVGIYTITQGTLSAGGNYAITFVPADFTVVAKDITVTADTQSKAYGETDPVLTYTSSESGVTFAGALSREAGEDVGTYAITQGTLSAGGNYTITFVSTDFSITPKPITVTADAKSKAFGEVDPELTYTSLESGITFSGTLSRLAGEDVGTYAITQGALSAGGNYTITFIPANLTITPKGITVTADGKSKVFGETDPVLTYSPSESGVTFSGILSREAGEDVGTYAITLGTLSAGANYAITFVSAGFTITPASASVTFSDLTHFYDGTPKSATVTTEPPGLSVSLTYNGSPLPPTMFGSYTVNSTVTDPNYTGTASGTLVILPARLADFDKDGDTDVAVFRPSNGRWFILGQPTIYWGMSGDTPAPADYDGDGDNDAAVFRPSVGRWLVKDIGTFYLGTTGDVPVPADYDGDGDADVAVFRPSNGRWFILGQPTIYWGMSGDIPVPADYDGNGTAEVAVFRPSVGRWLVKDMGTFYLGTTGDLPVVADYDGDGDADIAVFRPSNGRWFILGQPTIYWGVSGDIATPGDYNGDGSYEVAVFRPSVGRWLVKDIGTFYLGTTGDFPTSARDTNGDGDPYE